MQPASSDTNHESSPGQSSFLENAAAFVIRWRLVILGLAVLLTVFAWPVAARLRFEQSIESLYAHDDPHFAAYARSKAFFGGDEFAIVAWMEAGLLNDGSTSISAASRIRIEAVAEQLAAIPGTDSDSIQHAAGALSFPYKPDRVAELVEGVLIGADRETTAIVIRLLPEADSPVSRARTIAMIRQLASEQSPPAFVVGEPVQIHDMFRYAEADGRTLFQFSLALLACVLFLLFRTLRWVILPLGIVVLTIRWTEALLVLADARLSMVSSMMNSLVTIIGVATSTHLAMRFREYARTMQRKAALIRAVAELVPPIFWTCVTTAVGFAALISSSITPVRSFGLMMTVATLLVFVVVVLITPGGMARWFHRSDGIRRGVSRSSDWWLMIVGDPVPAPAEQYLVFLLRGVSRFVKVRPGLVAATTVTIVFMASLGMMRLRIETDFSKNFREDSELVQSLNFVESALGGAGTFEVNFPAPSPLTDEFLGTVRDLAGRLRLELSAESPHSNSSAGRLTKVVSLTDGLDLVPEKIGVGFLSKTLSLQVRLQLLSSVQREVVGGLYDSEQGRMRIMLRSLERQKSENKVSLIAKVDAIAREVLGATSSDAAALSAEFGHKVDASAVGTQHAVETTGMFVLLTFLIESLIRDQIVSFAVAAVGIGTMMVIAFRSLKIGLVALVPNVFPIVLVLGAMGWIGMPINIASAMIASVSMGLTVDNSVHYLSSYRRLRRDGVSTQEAIETTQTQVGRSLVFANIALVAGLSVLTMSQFIPLVYFGILVSVAMLGGLAGNLFLLPLLLGRLDADLSTIPVLDAVPAVAD
ncbi:MAG: MMPL family transporter [Planctomycetota bacterium]|nr:MMPL family transporter [Planctomycetota bacterium]